MYLNVSRKKAANGLASIRAMIAVLMMAGLALGGPAQAGDIEYGYDRAGRLISARYPNDTLVLYTYDAAGNRTRRLAESCVGSELAPTAVNDTLQVYIVAWLNEENMTWWYWAFSDPIDLLANDSDPSSFSLALSHLEETSAPLYQGDDGFFYSWESPVFPPVVNTIEYTVSNGHCQTDTATLTINYQML